MTLLPFIIIQHAHFWFRHIPACSCLQIGHTHDCCCCCSICCCCFDLLATYSHNKIKGIPNAKNMPIVRIGICNTNNDIPKHNVAKPRAKIQRLVRLSIIYTIQAPLYSIYVTTIWYMGFPLRSVSTCWFSMSQLVLLSPVTWFEDGC